MQVLEGLGVLEEVQQKGISMNTITLAKQNLKPLYSNHQKSIKKKFGYTSVAIHRAALQKILLENIPKGKIHLGKEFACFTETNTQITTSFQDGTSVVSNYVLGADGIHSKVRNQLFPESKKRYSGQTCWRGVAEMEVVNVLEKKGLELWGDQIRFGVSQIAKNKIYWFAVALDKENKKDTENVSLKLQKLFADFHPVINKVIKATPEHTIIRNDIHDLHPLSKWYHNNVCLLGDAAHATTPNMGQGGAQAIEDAYYISKLVLENPNKNIFQDFQKIRRKKVAYVVKQSWNTGKMAHLKYGQSFRNLLLKSIPETFFEKSFIKLYQLD